jgi:type IV secretion system protein VirB9
MKIFTALLLAAIASSSCASVSVERSVRDSAFGKQEKPFAETFQVDFPVETVETVVERPVFIPEKEPARPPPPSGAQAVQDAFKTGVLKPSEYSHAALVYDFDPDFVYEVYAAPLRVCDLFMEPGEQVAEPPFVSDSARWQIGAGVSYSQGAPIQHVYVKPSEPGIEASLVINTDRRVYHVILRSYRETHMPIVRWRYRAPDLPSNYFTRDGQPPRPGENNDAITQTATPSVNPRLLSFKYRVTYQLFKKPPWLPALVFDDGSKTYLAFPESVLNQELPAVFENRRDVLNYRVHGNLVIIDKLVSNITVKINKDAITVKRKN